MPEKPQSAKLAPRVRAAKLDGGALLSFVALVAIAATLLFGRVALADAAPVQLVLVYTPKVSNTGTPNASGIAELVLSEGEVRVQTADLPRLDGDSQYVVWLVNSTTNAFQKLGSFNTAASTGAVDYETVLNDSITDNGWNLLLITVEASADADHPGDKHSIAGTFPNAANAALPEILPNTGGADDAPITANPVTALGDHASLLGQSEWMLVSVLGALVVGVTFAAGYGLGLKRR